MIYQLICVKMLNLDLNFQYYKILTFQHIYNKKMIKAVNLQTVNSCLTIENVILVIPGHLSSLFTFVVELE